MTPRRRRPAPAEPPGESGFPRSIPFVRRAEVSGDLEPALGADPALPDLNASPSRRIRVKDVRYGEFPQITSLNSGFLPGARRLMISVTIHDGLVAGSTAGLVEALTGFLPSLSFHRCCGGNSVRETFFDRDRRRHCAVREADDGVDLAHLVEHVMIDILHFIARLDVCSGVTCARTSPRDQYDIFVECPDERIGRVCAGIAIDIVEDLLDGLRPDPRYLCLIQVARVARDHAGWPVEPRLGSLLATWGRRLVDEAVVALQRRGFLREIAVSFNFSGRPLLCFEPAAI